MLVVNTTRRCAEVGIVCATKSPGCTVSPPSLITLHPLVISYKLTGESTTVE